MLAVAVMMCVTNGALRLSVTNDESNLDAMIAARSVPIHRRFSASVARTTRRNGSLNTAIRIRDESRDEWCYVWCDETGDEAQGRADATTSYSTSKSDGINDRRAVA
jgi:hypothetical protein